MQFGKPIAEFGLIKQKLDEGDKDGALRSYTRGLEIAEELARREGAVDAGEELAEGRVGGGRDLPRPEGHEPLRHQGVAGAHPGGVPGEDRLGGQGPVFSGGGGRGEVDRQHLVAEGLQVGDQGRVDRLVLAAPGQGAGEVDLHAYLPRASSARWPASMTLRRASTMARTSVATARFVSAS